MTRVRTVPLRGPSQWFETGHFQGSWTSAEAAGARLTSEPVPIVPDEDPRAEVVEGWLGGFLARIRGFQIGTGAKPFAGTAHDDTADVALSLFVLILKRLDVGLELFKRGVIERIELVGPIERQRAQSTCIMTSHTLRRDRSSLTFQSVRPPALPRPYRS